MKTVGTAFSLMLAASFALAQEMPRPAPELAELKFFAGTWTCRGTAPDSPLGKAHPTRNTTEMRLDLDGFWYAGSVTEVKTAQNPQPVKGRFHLGYDPAAKQYVFFWVDNFGSSATETTAGWQGDTIVFQGEQRIMGEKATARDSFVKKSATEYTHKFELEMKGQWSTILEESCRRAGRK